MNAPGPIGVVAHYNLLERLEPSGPGDLYRARDTRLGRTVALRLLPADFTTGADSRAALVAQARAMTVLSHPNVTTLFDAGEHEGRVYLAFEFLKGQSLRAEMAGRPLKVQRAVEAAIQITDAIADAHANGFVHGGLSPESVAMTQRGHAKIPAFELAAHGGFDSRRPDRAKCGCSTTCRPRRPADSPADDRSDIYSVGAILYEMLTAQAAQPEGRRGAERVEPSRAARARRASCCARWRPIPTSRPQSAAAFASELRGVTALIDAQGGASDESRRSARDRDEHRARACGLPPSSS